MQNETKLITCNSCECEFKTHIRSNWECYICSQNYCRNCGVEVKLDFYDYTICPICYKELKDIINDISDIELELHSLCESLELAIIKLRTKTLTV